MNTLQATLNVVRDSHVTNLELRDTIRKHCIVAEVSSGKVRCIIHEPGTTRIVSVRSIAELLSHVKCQYCFKAQATRSTMSSSCLTNFFLCEKCAMMSSLSS